jgi:hypothetical protein
MQVPADAADSLRDVFRACDERITAKLSRNPNIPEEFLDLALVDHQSHYSAAHTLSSDRTVRLETHYLGGLITAVGDRDIAVLLSLRGAGKLETSKVAPLR